MTVIDKRGGAFTVYFTPVIDLRIALRFVSSSSAIDLTGQSVTAYLYYENNGPLSEVNYTATVTDAGDGRATVTIPASYFNSLENDGFGETVGILIARNNGTETVEQVGGVIQLTDTEQGGGYSSGNLLTVDVSDLTVEIAATDGLPGSAATVTVGTVSGLASGATPTVTNSGTSSAAVLDFGLPIPDDGTDGTAATIAVGTVTTLPSGSSATVTNVGTSAEAIFDFELPQGADGAGTGTVTSVAISGSNGISFTGSPITSNGTFTMSINASTLRSHLNVEDGADATDTANVTAAGALMDSEVTNLAQVKAFDSTDYAAASHSHAASDTTSGTFADARISESSVTQHATKKGQIEGINAQTGTSYTAVLADAGKVVTMDNASANTFTIPANASVAYPVNTVLSVTMKGAGVTSIEGDTGVTLNGVSAGSGDMTTQFQSVSIVKIDTNEWIASGDIGTVA